MNLRCSPAFFACLALAFALSICFINKISATSVYIPSCNLNQSSTTITCNTYTITPSENMETFGNNINTATSVPVEKMCKDAGLARDTCYPLVMRQLARGFAAFNGKIEEALKAYESTQTVGTDEAILGCECSDDVGTRLVQVGSSCPAGTTPYHSPYPNNPYKFDGNGVCRNKSNTSNDICIFYAACPEDPSKQCITEGPCSGTGGTYASCTLPWGGTLAHGATVQAYTVAASTSCSAITLSCNNGTLSNTGTLYASCEQRSCSSYCQDYGKVLQCASDAPLECRGSNPAGCWPAGVANHVNCNP